MTDAATEARSCPRCGGGFGCSVAGKCWCMDEPFRMPMPQAGATAYADCLCPACLREVAAEPGLSREPA